MYTQKKWLAVAYDACLGLLALGGIVAIVLDFGDAAWRVFTTWALLLAVAYYLSIAIIVGLSKERQGNDTPSPMIAGAVIVSLTLSSGVSIACRAYGIEHPMVQGLAAGLVYAVLPILVLGHWVFFIKKGSWRMIEPFYWLALPVIYVSVMLITSVILPTTIAWRYPLPFLSYAKTHIFLFRNYLCFFAMMIFVFSYALVMIDALLSGKFSRRSLLSHLQSTPSTDLRPVSIETITLEASSKNSDLQGLSAQNAKPKGTKTPMPTKRNLKSSSSTKNAKNSAPPAKDKAMTSDKKPTSAQDIKPSVKPRFKVSPKKSTSEALLASGPANSDDSSDEKVTQSESPTVSNNSHESSSVRPRKRNTDGVLRNEKHAAKTHQRNGHKTNRDINT